MNKKNIKIITIIIFITFISAVHIPVIYAAGSLTTAKITISDSRAGESDLTHTFSFTTGTTGILKTIEMQYCTTPTGTCTTPNGLSTTIATQGTITGLGANTTDVTTNGTLILTITSPISVSSGTTITIPYSQITNPIDTNTSFFVRITSKDNADAIIDSTIVAFATLISTSLAVSADVGVTFSVALAAVTAGTVNGQTINITSTTATTVPFGTLAPGATRVVAHDITVLTNATNGYSVTVKAGGSPPLTDGSNNIDNFTEPNTLPQVWSSPAGASPNVNTGFFGYTTEDTSLCTGTPNRFTGNKWAGFDTTAYEIVCNPNSVPAGEITRIGWQTEVNGTQPSGSYTGDVIIVTTPMY